MNTMFGNTLYGYERQIVRGDLFTDSFGVEPSAEDIVLNGTVDLSEVNEILAIVAEATPVSYRVRRRSVAAPQAAINVELRKRQLANRV